MKKIKNLNLNLIKGLAIPCVIVVMFLVFQKMLPAYANMSSSQVTVVASELNVREDADNSSKIIEVVHRGETFEVMQTKNSWDQIKLPSNQTGWVYNAYVSSNNHIEATVEALVLNVREQPSLSSPIVATLKMGANITVSEEQAGWAKIVSSSGAHGWVYSYYISKKTTSSVPVPPSQSAGKSSSPEKTRTSAISGGQASAQSLKGKTIVLDPGHGGVDIGTTSITGTHEKDLTLETAKAVEQKLKNAGVNVVMTRENDSYMTLQQRSSLSNQLHADAFISFHYNWSNDPAISGLTDFYYNQSKDSSLATEVLNGVVNATGLKNIGTKFNDLSVLRNNSQPSVLIELGFVSNKEEDSVVENAAYNNAVAEGVYLGLLNYFS
jgi:N-acetylmuramoyl-L-alanine amidase